MLRRAVSVIAILFALAVPGCQLAPFEDLDASTLDAAAACSDGLSDISGSSADLAAGSTTFIPQPVIIDYQPENPFTPAREEMVRVTMNGGTATYAPDDDTETTDPSNDLPVGSRIRLGFTAGSYSYVYRPSGGPATTFGARVQARFVLTSFVPPSGPASPTYTDRVLLSRAQFCPEL